MRQLENLQFNLRSAARSILPQSLRTFRYNLRKSVIKRLRKWYVSLGVQHVSGPTEINLQPTDAVVVSLVRNGEAHIKTFLQHHFDLGVRHIVLLDNDSVDRTIEHAQQYDRVTVLHSTLPYKKYKNHFWRYLFNRFGRNGWCLVVDIDERFDFPFSDSLPLSGFLHYLNRHGYTAVVAQMLDLFAQGPPDAWPRGGKELIEHCVWYDNSALIKRDYREWMKTNSIRVSNDAIQQHRGGIRKAAFGVNPWLTKHPLLFKGGGTRLPDNNHKCCFANIADVSCVLYHYKFSCRFVDKCRTAARRGNYSMGSREYKGYLQRLRQNPQLELKQGTARKLQSVNQLVDEEFIVVSDIYRHFVQRWDRKYDK